MPAKASPQTTDATAKNKSPDEVTWKTKLWQRLHRHNDLEAAENIRLSRVYVWARDAIRRKATLEKKDQPPVATNKHTAGHACTSNKRSKLPSVIAPRNHSSEFGKSSQSDDSQSDDSQSDLYHPRAHVHAHAAPRAHPYISEHARIQARVHTQVHAHTKAHAHAHAHVHVHSHALAHARGHHCHQLHPLTPRKYFARQPISPTPHSSASDHLILAPFAPD
ncbi:hypothetical protein EK21DRAFT_83941 [Setomelanomma holmii]|uniref:Uncharacterized protein n=1 Tax=Setomelanomma holmii TaxID=210430 RepID=A0A9P4LV00_9PLEO|nr:hypothetical protein EK21DRAFT_83941 [Setomelanomma holmii]